MKNGIVDSAFIRSNYRFDGKFHLSEGLEVRHIINRSPYGNSLISDVTSDIYCPGIFRRNYTKSGTPFLGGGDIQKADYDSGKYLRVKTTPNYEILQIKKGWTLVTCGGTIGDTVFANNLLAKCWVSQHVMRVVPSTVKEGMLFAYLASKYGHLLLTTNTYGSVIPTLNASNIASIPIPNFPLVFQQKVDDLIQESARLREEAAKALKDAIIILSDYVNAKLSQAKCKTSVVNIQDIRKSLQQRIDPPALMNEGVEAMQEVISRLPYKLLGELGVVVRRPGIFKRIYVENGIPYIKGSEIFLTNPFQRCEHLSKTRTPFVEEMALKEGQILVTCAGSCGNIKMITREYEEKQSIGSQDIIRIDSNDGLTDNLVNKEYLFTYLQLPFVYSYIQSMKYGSVIERIEPFHVESIPVVVPPKELSCEIQNKIQIYMEATYKAFKAEEEAISMVEEEIEKWNN